MRYGGITRDNPVYSELRRRWARCSADRPDNRIAAPMPLASWSAFPAIGFTHDPVIVFEAARLLRDDSDIHFLLSGGTSNG